ncbi:hypothetical protein KO505_07270 [Psychrosphaera sp. F3M07]|uniref:hypothetical protein n=1 Tax=Psychrosphaera sp. F3M07 TaxID=2841560 RepID=UPI001C092535|nr:hypothetical protein [Psychrosphaera sp. F3M07]MBU2917762.1 hypothetical protein [Psychrosphaera sp. F3M07]
MNFNRGIFNKIKRGLPIIFAAHISLTLFGCDSDSSSGTGYIQMYNLSSNAPDIYLTVDQYSDDDFVETAYSGVPFTGLSSRLEFESTTYDIELAWQDEYNSSDLENIYESQLSVSDDMVEFVVMTDDVRSPNVLVYELPIRDEDEVEEDSDDEVFNIRILNMHDSSQGVDIYYSESDESFNEAQLISQTNYTQMSENQKLAQDDLIFYLTLAGSTEVLFQSQDISFPYAAEYIIVIRENTGAGTSPFIIDKLSTTSSVEYSDINAEAQYRIYNGIVEHELLPEYQGMFDFYVNGVDEEAEVSSLTFGQFSDSILSNSGDFSMSLLSPADQSVIVNNHLLSLSDNTNTTVFFYLLEEAVDEDGDNDVDENGDGYIDEIEISINSLVVNNSQSESIYSHQINVINLIDENEISDDFSYIKVYFVKSDETISSADQSTSAVFATPSSVQLLNNTYEVYVIGRLGSSDVILTSQELVLDENSKDQFLILEKDLSSSTNYKMAFVNQAN